MVSSSDTFFLGEGAVLIVSLDGQCLIVSARDGCCTLVTFDEILPAYHVQQHTIRLQSIAMMIPVTIPASGTVGLPASQIPPVVVQDPSGTRRVGGMSRRWLEIWSLDLPRCFCVPPFLFSCSSSLLYFSRYIHFFFYGFLDRKNVW